MADDPIKKFVAHRNFLSVVIVHLQVRPTMPRGARGRPRHAFLAPRSTPTSGPGAKRASGLSLP